MGFPNAPTDANLLAWVGFLLTLAAGFFAAVHALLYKRHSRAAFGWIVTSLFIPIIGPALYGVFGVNRVGNRAQQYARERAPVTCEPDPNSKPEPSIPAALTVLDRISAAVTGRPLTHGNRVRALHNGDEAYPAMLAAIDAAQRYVLLASYIFDSDTTGRAFVDALRRAKARGVAVYVLIDGVGEWYGRPRIGRLLADAQITFARFLPPRLVPPTIHINLRNHRKLLVVDDAIAFTGGMNIGDRHLMEGPHARLRHEDLHFALEGPIVCELRNVFEADWRFADGQTIPPATWVATPRACAPASESAPGPALARAIVDGPDLDLDKLLLVIIGAISSARERIRIATPYFLPSRELSSALQAAALRGVEVSIVIPRNNNLPFIRWATHHMVWELLKRGVQIYERPGAFSHAKLLLIDDHYTQIGSANMDDRSLRLNFEAVVEILDPGFVRTMNTWFEAEVAGAQALTLADVDNRSLAVRIRDGFFWLFAPYL